MRAAFLPILALATGAPPAAGAGARQIRCFMPGAGA